MNWELQKALQNIGRTIPKEMMKAAYPELKPDEMDIKQQKLAIELLEKSRRNKEKGFTWRGANLTPFEEQALQTLAKPKEKTETATNMAAVRELDKFLDAKVEKIIRKFGKAKEDDEFLLWLKHHQK